LGWVPVDFWFLSIFGLETEWHFSFIDIEVVRCDMDNVMLKEEEAKAEKGRYP